MMKSIFAIGLLAICCQLQNIPVAISQQLTTNSQPTIAIPSAEAPAPNQLPFYCFKKRDRRDRKFPKQTNIRARQRLVYTIHGFSMYVDSRDITVSQKISIEGTWEPHYINLIGHLLKAEDNVLNLGSQSGLEAIIMGKIIQPGGGKLFIFEPYSFSHSLVSKNIEYNELSNITTIYKVGASDEKAKGTIRGRFSNTGASQIRPLDPDQKPQPKDSFEQQVQLDMVDSLLPPDIALNFALIDVQKMQIKALKGMKGIIERSPSLLIMTEWQYKINPRRNEEETLEFLRWLVGRGYGIYRYEGGNTLACTIGKFVEYKIVEDVLQVGFTDIFFIPKDHPILAQ